MKKQLLLLCLLVIGQQVFSQKSPKDSLTKLIAADICKEIAANEATLKSFYHWKWPGPLMFTRISIMQNVGKVMPALRWIGPGVEHFQRISVCRLIGLPRLSQTDHIDKNSLQAGTWPWHWRRKSITGILQKVESNEFTSVHINCRMARFEKYGGWIFYGANSLLDKGRLNKEYYRYKSRLYIMPDLKVR